jgi:hypothetical protein
VRTAGAVLCRARWAVLCRAGCALQLVRLAMTRSDACAYRDFPT